MFGINYRDGRPIYEQVMEQIEQMIVHGVFEPDSRLPSVRQLAAELSINPNTIQRAYSALESRGVIYSAKGKGNFVSADCAALHQRRVEEFREKFIALLHTAREMGIEDTVLIQWITDKGGRTQ